MEYPKLEELNASNCTERSIEIHYHEFWKYIIENYHCLKWTERLYWFYHNLKEYPKCPVCGKPTNFINLKNGYREFCSTKCMNSCKDIQERKKQTSLKNWGTESPMKSNKVQEKLKNSVREKYGVDNPFQMDDFKEKRKKTCLEKYGVEHHLQNPEIMSKQISTNIKKYGVECISQRDDYKKIIKQTNENKYGGTGYASPEINNKIKQTNLDLYGVENVVLNEEISNTISISLRNNSIRSHERLIGYTPEGDWIMKCPHPECNKCQEKFYITYSGRENDRIHAKLETCTKLAPINSPLSFIEDFVKNILNEYNIPYETNVIGLLDGRKEIDIYIPSHKLAIECNGVYWHSDKYKDKNYHINKYNQCKSNGIMLVQIWEDWLKNKPEIVKSILLNKLGLLDNTIYARKCIIKEVGSQESNIFLDNNHIQGRSSASIKLGLYYNDELVSLMTFSTPRINMGAKQHKQQWELVRFCSKLNTRVVGGASKLFNYFIKTYNPISMVSFSMNDISNGNLYDKLGFIKECENISYWYIEPHTDKRYHRASFSKQMIIKKGWKDSKEGWTEYEVMDEKGYYRIYDAGQTKWVWNKKE